MGSDVKIVDPIWSSAYIQRDFGYMVWDVLFALDDKFDVKPQMVETWDISPDKLTWTFTLRDNKWSNGQPVTAEDCIASLKRWGARDSMGQRMLALVDGFEAVDARTFRMKLQRALRPGAGIARQGLVERALHDAQEDGRDAAHGADQGRGRDRLGPLRLQGRRVEAGREGGVHQEHRQQAARPSRRPAWPAASSPSSIASNGSGSPTPKPR